MCTSLLRPRNGGLLDGRLRLMVGILLLTLGLLAAPFVLALAHIGLERIPLFIGVPLLVTLLISGSLRARHSPRPPKSRAFIKKTASTQTELLDAA